MVRNFEPLDKLIGYTIKSNTIHGTWMTLERGETRGRKGFAVTTTNDRICVNRRWFPSLVEARAYFDSHQEIKHPTDSAASV